MNDGSLIRAALFFGVLGAMLALEALRPRLRGLDRRRRWPANLGLGLINGALLAALPIASISIAAWGQAQGWGLLARVDAPAWLETLLAFLALDLAIYWQHRWLHEWRWAWPLHRVHHTDVALDATTGVRFHPGEIALSLAWKAAVILALGAPPLAVLALELALNGFAFWSHANLQLPAALDRALRALVITPDLHRVHHSLERAETDSNYGGSLSLWDRLFGSYRAHAALPLARMPVGLREHRGPDAQTLRALLAQPLSSRPSRS